MELSESYSGYLFSRHAKALLPRGAMNDSVSFRQQRRRAFEPPSRDWETTRHAIIAAGGAREADVDAERLARERQAEDAKAWAGARNMTPEELAEYAFGGGMQQASAESLAEFTGAPTLIDALWHDRFAGGVEDEA
jgi:hypothetical protein